MRPAAGVEPNNEGLFSMQGYLKPAPEGIDAASVWERNARGEGTAFIDIESGWFPGHEQLQLQQSIIHGNNLEADAGHGTAVLGIILASGDDRGIVGVAPGARVTRLISGDRIAGRPDSGVANAIETAITLLQAGDVLLLEVQKEYKPVEVEDHEFEAIRSAVSKGIIVIEAAGNGGLNLDRAGNRAKTRSLRIGAPDFEDSGAVMVGASNKRVLRGGLHSRHKNSNYGSRIDCYGWGEGIVTTTTGYGDLGPETTSASKYTRLFGGTSGAAAIVAGAALLLQSLYQSRRGGRLSPPDMRVALSDAATGTGQRLGSPTDPIGVMPDLRKIIHKLGLA
jgi:serine protease